MDESDKLPRAFSAVLNTSLFQSQRLLSLSVSAPLTPHRLVGEQRVTEPFHYTPDCFSQQGDIELKRLTANRLEAFVSDAKRQLLASPDPLDDTAGGEA
ncbi:hypothetical protein [Marinobacter persicus]|uniref:Uncharacterized protein n=1 Tax=Marinobacter persicus TaxID=930118 RepID=A0A2S6G3Q8_9GAMM|nr:hypothetical protein [Marinobacter persicus]PPK50443.1 hypothetical protein BY455_1252 [Marinobacter persicus]PPK53725.1 hypothetical protein B0H24_10252 [Marinobacter persicus]PPK57004.1 hypothetical protein BY454_12748 [Marinobacter persicus]